MWEVNRRALMHPSSPPKLQHESKKHFYSGIHSLMAHVELMMQKCKPEEIEKRMTDLRIELQEEMEELQKNDALYEFEEGTTPAGEWRSDLAARIALKVHSKIGNNMPFFRSQTERDAMELIARAEKRNQGEQ